METALYLTRFLHYAAAMQLFGAAVFQAWLAPPTLRAAEHRGAWTVAAASVALLLASGLLWLALTAGSMAGGWAATIDPAIIGKVLTATGFGRVWSVRLLLLALILGVALWLHGGRGWWLLASLSTLGLASLGLVGHAAADTGLIGVLHVSSQIVHLLSSAFWVGSLLPLVFCLLALDSPVLGREADVALRRFSGLGHFAVALALASGVTNSWFILRNAEIDPSAPYQALLIIKVLLVGLMVCIALVNRYVFVPGIEDGGRGARLLRHGTIAEIVITGVVLAVVAVLGTLPPS